MAKIFKISSLSPDRGCSLKNFKSDSFAATLIMFHDSSLNHHHLSTRLSSNWLAKYTRVRVRVSFTFIKRRPNTKTQNWRVSPPFMSCCGSVFLRIVYLKSEIRSWLEFKFYFSSLLFSTLAIASEARRADVNSKVKFSFSAEKRYQKSEINPHRVCIASSETWRGDRKYHKIAFFVHIMTHRRSAIRNDVQFFKFHCYARKFSLSLGRYSSGILLLIFGILDHSTFSHSRYYNKHERDSSLKFCVFFFSIVRWMANISPFPFLLSIATGLDSDSIVINLIGTLDVWWVSSEPSTLIRMSSIVAIWTSLLFVASSFFALYEFFCASTSPRFGFTYAKFCVVCDSSSIQKILTLPCLNCWDRNK